MSNRFARRAGLLVAISTLGACASSSPNRAEMNGKADLAGTCAVRPQDSTFTVVGPVYRDCAVTTKALLLTKDIHPDFHPPERSSGCYVAEMEYVVNEKGAIETATARVVRTNNQAFADAVISILPQWKFEPGKINDVPVRQIVTAKQQMMTRMVEMPAGSSPSSAAAKASMTRPRPSC